LVCANSPAGAFWPFIGDSNLRKANKRFVVIQGGRTAPSSSRQHGGPAPACWVLR